METPRVPALPSELPVLPVRSAVLLPSAMVPLTVGRAASLRALGSVSDQDGGFIAVVAQRDPSVDEPRFEDLHTVGTAGLLLRVSEVSEDQGAVIAFVQGLTRIRLIEPVQEHPMLVARVEALHSVVPSGRDPEFEALVRSARELFEEIVRDAPDVPADFITVLGRIRDPSGLADFVAASTPGLSGELRQRLLETLDVRDRLRTLVEELVKERENQKLRNKIRSDVQERVSETQRKFMLRQQLDAIRRELGEEDQVAGDLAELRARIAEAKLPDEARHEAERELSRLERIPPESPEFTVARTYLDWIVSLPWNITSAREVDLEYAQQVLDDEHYDLEKVKERILEHLAVYRLRRDLRGPILCLVGPPGVGKTSLGRAIARATGRKFARISLGGMRDEAEIRGHRRTYIGALPGQIIRALRRAGASDPVFMLDEVDKLGADFRGDPAAALLEVLDPEQNHAFRDNYLDLPFDLSRVLFITTANLLDPVLPALRDRMEVLELPGYIDEEKIQIARRFIIPRQAEENAVALDTQIRFTDEAIAAIIDGYTHEAGVRLLEQKIAAIFRKRARQIASDGHDTLVVTREVVREMLGPPRFRVETQLEERTRDPGVAVALAWTPHGGDILFVEASRMPRDRGEFVITGQVRDVMKESAVAAFSWLRAHASAWGIAPDAFARSDVHVHVPAGAVPKDGPSAGIVMVAALLSLFTGRPIRPFLAMTGEITLSGRLLPVGGIKEKVLAARRSGVREVVMPALNRDDLEEDVPEHLREGLTFHFADTIEEALEAAFEPERADYPEEPPRPPAAPASHPDPH